MVLGADLLFNWGPFNLDGEWHQIVRQGNVVTPATVDDFEVTNTTGHIRVSYNITFTNGRIIEPMMMFTFFDGPTGVVEQGYAALAGAFAGKDHAYVFGINYYLNPKLKLI